MAVEWTGLLGVSREKVEISWKRSGNKLVPSFIGATSPSWGVVNCFHSYFPPCWPWLGSARLSNFHFHRLVLTPSGFPLGHLASA